MIKTDIENLFSGLKNKISLLQHELVVEYGVPEGAINFVLNSDEFMKLSYFLIKTGFKSGLFRCLASNIFYMQFPEKAGNYLHE